MKTRIRWIVLCLLAALAVAGVLNLQAQRQATAQPEVTVEYLVIPASDLGIDTNDVLLRLDYDEATRRLNRYAADGWRVSSFGLFGRTAVVLERELVR